MSEKLLPSFSLTDKEILDELDVTFLEESINFLCSFDEVQWKHGDTGVLYNKELLPASKKQSLPVYPEELLKIGMYFYNLVGENYADLFEEGFFNRDNLVFNSLGTMFSPHLICTLIADSFNREPFCEGLFAAGVSDKFYLKMLLHLLDCKKLYEARKESKNNPLVNDVVSFIKKNKILYVSVSFLQRNFSLSFPKATEILSNLMDIDFISKNKTAKGYKVI